MNFGKDTQKQAHDLIESMRRASVKTFGEWAIGLSEKKELMTLIRYAKSLHRIALHDCNGTKTKRMESIEASTEKKITAIAAKFGLTVHFDGDPRGYVVKLHAPKGDVYNTWGGKETGYGVG